MIEPGKIIVLEDHSGFKQGHEGLLRTVQGIIARTNLQGFEFQAKSSGVSTFWFRAYPSKSITATQALESLNNYEYYQQYMNIKMPKSKWGGGNPF